MPNEDEKVRSIPSETDETPKSTPAPPAAVRVTHAAAAPLPPRGVPEPVAKPSTPPSPKGLALHQRTKGLAREWFARIRIREDRLARLWVSNLAGHDVVVWSKKEKRWVALLAVPELRRALQTAETEVPKGSRRPPSIPPRSLGRPPDSLPPTPPLASMDAAAAGIGELRLRSIAQNQSLGLGGSPRDINRALIPSLLLPSVSGARPRARRQRPLSRRYDQHAAGPPKPWHWRAMERAAWAAAGVIAMFIVSSAGSTDQHTAPQGPAPIVLVADRFDQQFDQPNVGENVRALGALFVGPPQQCLARSTTGAPCAISPEAEPSTDEPTREAPRQARQRPLAEGSTRPRATTALPSAHDLPVADAEVPSDLNFPAIRAALFNAAALARACPGENISGKTVVTFEPTGSVHSVDLPLLVGKKPDRSCIIRSFKTVRVPPFTGRRVAVKKDF